MLTGNAAIAPLVRPTAGHDWSSDFGESTSLHTDSFVRPSIQLSKGDILTAKAAVWVIFVPDQPMAHPVLTGRDSRMHFKDRTYVALPPPDDNADKHLLGELALSLNPPTTGATVFSLDSTISGDHV